MLQKKAAIAVTLGLVILSGIASAAVIDRTIPGIITGSSQFGNHEAPRWVFDNRTDTKWLATSPTGWVQFEFMNNQAFAINSYAITSANDAAGRDPKAWTLLGSNDGTNWSTVDTRSNESWVARYQRRVFKCTNTTPYRMYRLNVTQNNGDDIMQFSELELIENGISRTAYYQFSWSSQINDGEGGKLVLDKLTGSKWLTGGDNTTGWIQYQFLGKGAYAINEYAITSANDAPDRDPKDWTLQGSFDGTTWVTLDTRVGETWTDRFERREFTFMNNVAYSHYKLDVTANNGSGNLMGFSEFELLERDLPGAAKYVGPAEMAYEIPVDAQLDWEIGVDPNTGVGAWDAIGGHYVYLGTAPDQMLLMTPAALPVGTTSFDPELVANKTYYWMIEEAVKTDGGVYPAGDPNNAAGRVWRFNTETTLVQINPESPVNAFAHPGGSAAFTVEATDPMNGTITYQWYYDPDTELENNEVQLTQGSKYQGVNTSTLTINDVTEADKGAYFCGVANASGVVVYSKTANLYVKKTLAHWTLDAASYNGTTYADATGLGHDAALVGSPTFTEGVADGDKNADNAVANGAVSFVDPNSCADAGGFNPSEETSAFSISAWVNWLGITDVTSGMIAAKRDNWSSEDNNYWIFMVSSEGQVRMQSQNRSTLNTAKELVTEGQWHHVAVTYIDGVARIYVDGLQQAVGGFNLANKADATFWIGRNESIGERFDGLIDDLKAFNYALSPEEVVDLYYAETGNPVCIYGNPVGDLNNDCKISIDDFAVMAQQWLTDGFYPNL
ncbi:MAG: discoidin domain-containing protein [Sedimentisphaerales bacterium]|nr:discoidin domain-containing protein [Sedimentisphaerales bacterium]